MIPAIPDGPIEIETIFGYPGDPDTHHGRVHFPTPIRLGWFPSEVVITAACHVLMEEPFENVFRALYDRGLWPLVHTFDGIYNYRNARRGKKISTHAWGIAVDLNASENPLGEVPTMDQRIVATFEEFGFFWGGRWHRPDGMHFQWATNY